MINEFTTSIAAQLGATVPTPIQQIRRVVQTIRRTRTLEMVRGSQNTRIPNPQ